MKAARLVRAAGFARQRGVPFAELVSEMVREDLRSAERDELVKRHGFKSMNYHE